MAKLNKYRAKRTVIDGIPFASQKEALRYRELRLLQRAGEIEDLTLQPRFRLYIEQQPILIRSNGYPNGRQATYLADFQYKDKNGVLVVEDVKGMDTPVSRLKRAIVEAQYRIRVELI